MLSGEETRSPVAPSIFTLSSLRTKKKSGQAFIYCFACFLIAVFTIAIQGRDAPVHSFYESLSPVFFLFFFEGQVVLLCKELDGGASVMMHSGSCFFFFLLE